MHPPRTLGAAMVAAAVLGPASSRAEEGGTGHYTPGLWTPVPGREGVSLSDFFLFRPGDQETFGNFIAVIDRTASGYAFGAVLSVYWLDFNGETESGIGDALLYPAIFAWTSGAFTYDVRLGIYAPIGKFQSGVSTNLGKNYWTFEPGATLSYSGSFEATVFAGVDLNTKNKTTDYLSGRQLHVDGAVAARFASGDGRFGVGAHAFWYQQISGDSGTGAVLGEFKGRTAGVGPVVSYATGLTGADARVELKWLPELTTENRLKGHYFWIELGARF